MIITEPALIDLLVLCRNSRPDEIEQYEALIEDWDMEHAAVRFWRSHGLKFVLLDTDGNQVCAGGWDEIIAGVYQGWMVGTLEQWDRHWRSITKYTRRVMDSMFTVQGARRLQIGALASRTAACHWYEKGLGMTREAELRAFGRNGEDMVVYSRVRGESDG